MTRKRTMDNKRLLPLIAAGLLVTTGFFGFMPASGDDHWDPEPQQDPETGRFILDTLDEFDDRGAYGLWEIMAPNDAVQRSGQFRPTFFTTDRDYLNVDFHTNIRTPLSPTNDNGFIGFVVNFNEPDADANQYDTVIIDWNSRNLTSGQDVAREGLTMYHIQGEVPDNNIDMRNCFFAKNDTACPADITILHTFQVDALDRPGGYRNTTEDRGWVPGGEEYEVRITYIGDHPQASHTPGIIVSIKGGPVEDWNPYNGTFRDTVQSAFDSEPASLGFYTFNQGGSTNGAAQFQNPTYHDGIQPQLFIERTCPDGEQYFDGWCAAPVALNVDVVDHGSGVASVECTINGDLLPDCDRDHEEPGVFDLDLSLFKHTGPTGAWTASATQATQTEALGGVSFYTSQSGALPRDGLFLNVDYLGEIDAPPTGANNNIIGWAFGLDRPTASGTLAESYIIDWKAEEQTHLGHTAPEGLTFYRVDGNIGTTDDEIFACYWGKDPQACADETGAELEILASHTGLGTGWEHDAQYTFRLEHYEDRVALTLQGGTNYATETTVIEVNDQASFPELGYYGAYNFRQEDVTYRNLAFEELGQQIAIHGAILNVVAFDHAGNKVERNVNLKVDLQNPDVDINVGCTEVNGWCNDNVSLSVSANALSGIYPSLTICELDGAPSSCSQTISDDGAYTFTAQATSFVQRIGTDATAFLRDATAPQGALVEPVPGCAYVNGESTLCLGETIVIGDLEFNVTASDPVVNGVSSSMDRAEFYQDDELFATVQDDGSGWFNATWTPSGIGPTTVEVHLIDVAGNVEILEYDAITLLL